MQHIIGIGAVQVQKKFISSRPIPPLGLKGPQNSASGYIWSSLIFNFKIIQCIVSGSLITRLIARPNQPALTNNQVMPILHPSSRPLLIQICCDFGKAENKLLADLNEQCPIGHQLANNGNQLIEVTLKKETSVRRRQSSTPMKDLNTIVLMIWLYL